MRLHLGWATPQGCCVGVEPMNPLAGTTAHKKNTSQEVLMRLHLGWAMGVEPTTSTSTV